MTFPTAGAAELFAGSTHRRFQIVNVVMEFAPTVPPDRQQAYEAALSRTIE
ncbi:hypothetical protein M1247_31285 [Mycobacterium sp. 21AC1]|uniref:hypothetical protein n=1 Tax=[Mycobacterium] appelbergii TaxID=2939269 RepID=UPI002938F2F2|nr:hypothetical protein [Mycobacterium sp. 21AC1]MDV3129426.1 hypothetical protein [Mycobacterium sp. 21AC1]